MPRRLPAKRPPTEAERVLDPPQETVLDVLDHLLDKGVVATACLYRSAGMVAEAAELLGRAADAEHFRAFAERTRAAFTEHYVSADGTVHSDAQTVYAVAIVFPRMFCR